VEITAKIEEKLGKVTYTQVAPRMSSVCACSAASADARQKWCGRWNRTNEAPL